MDQIQSYAIRPVHNTPPRRAREEPGRPTMCPQAPSRKADDASKGEYTVSLKLGINNYSKITQNLWEVKLLNRIKHGAYGQTREWYH